MTKLRVRDVRHLLLAKAILLAAGIPPTADELHGLNYLIDSYRQQVKLSNYLSQMLGRVAIEAVDRVRFYDESGNEMRFTGSERVIDLLRVATRLPWRVVVIESGEERYL